MNDRTDLKTLQQAVRAPLVLVTGALFAALLMVLLAGARPVKALPEYASLTGQSCGVCHVNPGGGGPRTLQGLLWAARGKPAQLPPVPAVLLAPDVQDGIELYKIACSGCHGVSGEGSSAIGLKGSNVSALATRSYLLGGIPALGMPAFKGQFTAAQFDALVNFVTALADNKVSAIPNTYPLAPSRLRGGPDRPPIESEGN